MHTHAQTYTHTHAQTYIYIYTYAFELTIHMHKRSHNTHCGAARVVLYVRNNMVYVNPSVHKDATVSITSSMGEELSLLVVKAMSCIA